MHSITLLPSEFSSMAPDFTTVGKGWIGKSRLAAAAGRIMHWITLPQ
jgi:hypothetical protein